VRTVLVVVALVAAALVATTLVALEGREVVVLKTVDAGGVGRATRTWVADEDAHAWIEAANPERPFLLALATHPDVELTRGGRVHRCQAEPMPNPAGHRHVRELLARKYGWADRWIGFLTDTSRSIAVRLGCE
jgi:hypothetical protein